MKSGNFLKITGLLLVALAIPGVVFLTRSKSQLGIKAGRTQEALVFFIPSRLKIKPGENFELSMKIDTGQKTTGGIQAVISFDSRLFKLQDIVESSSTFTNLSTQVAKDSILIEGNGRVSGKGTIANLSFKALTYGKGEIGIDRDSVVWDQDKKTNIIDQTAGAVVVVE